MASQSEFSNEPIKERKEMLYKLCDWEEYELDVLWGVKLRAPAKDTKIINDGLLTKLHGTFQK